MQSLKHFANSCPASCLIEFFVQSRSLLSHFKTKKIQLGNDSVYSFKISQNLQADMIAGALPSGGKCICPCSQSATEGNENRVWERRARLALLFLPVDLAPIIHAFVTSMLN